MHSLKDFVKDASCLAKMGFYEDTKHCHAMEKHTLGISKVVL
jgi:hypothetical protein